jgi:hypothetical protein
MSTLIHDLLTFEPPALTVQIRPDTNKTISQFLFVIGERLRNGILISYRV